jgi:hypothetical protein
MPSPLRPRLRSAFAPLAGCVLLALTALPSSAADPKAKAEAPPPSKEALLTVEDWQKVPLLPLKPGELDELIDKEFAKLAADGPAPKPAALTTDEQFLRRVYLDVTGRLPSAEEVTRFTADPDPRKREKLIDRLLDSDEYAAHWARYWSDVVASRVNPYMKRLAPIFESWLFEQFKKNRGWGDIVRDMLAAGAVLTDHAPQPPNGPKQPINGAAFFVATRYYEKTRTEGAMDAAAETARVFLGIQLQCAQCHDDRSGGPWERVQFHQFAAFFARAAGRPKHAKFGGQGALDVWAMVYYPDGEYDMPDAKDVNKPLLTHPMFLDGTSPGRNLNDKERRAALATYVTDKKNFWFSAAFVNRMWHELTGQGFFDHVDDMGPGKDVKFPAVLARLTGAFRGSDYDVKALLRAILNSKAYQRQFRMGEVPDEHLNFAAVSPARMRAPVLWLALANALEIPPAKPYDGPGAKPWAKFSRPFGPQGTFTDAFDFDPSLRAEGSLPQVLMMMNSAFIAAKIEAQANNMLGRLLRQHPDDADAVRALYLRVLARKPTDRELDKCRKYIARVGKRNEAFEDILWALINSPEFQTKR